MIGGILTLGLGAFSDKYHLVTLGYGIRTIKGHADDEVGDHQQHHRRRLARIKSEEEMILKIIVKMVTEDMLQ